MEWKDDHGVPSATSTAKGWEATVPDVAEAIAKGAAMAAARGEKRMQVITDLLYGHVYVNVSDPKRGEFGVCAALLTVPWIEVMYDAEMPVADEEPEKFEVEHHARYAKAIECVRQAAAMEPAASALKNAGVSIVVHSSEDNEESAVEL